MRAFTNSANRRQLLTWLTLAVAAVAMLLTGGGVAEGQENAAPIITNPGDQAYSIGDTIEPLTITVADADAEDTPTVTVTGLPNGLTFDDTRRQITGTVANDDTLGDHPVTITANDGKNDAVTETFIITVTAPDVAPTFGSETIPVQTYAVNTAIGTLTLPPATGGNGTLTYSLAPTLPDGLSFDPGNRQITGTPTTAQAATPYTYKVVDSDTNTADSDAATLTLTITVESTTRCTDNDVSAQQSTSVPGSSFDLTFEFPGNCQPEGYRDHIITVVLDEAIGVPAGFDRGDVIVIATGRYYPSFVSAGTTESDDREDDHEIEVAGCGQWRYSLSDNNNVSCSESENLRSIQLRGLTLPNRPAADPNEGYPVAIQWGNNQAFTGKIGVDAALKVDGDKLVGFGESIKFEGSGFSDGVTVNLYAQPGTSSVACTNAGGAGWTNIGSTNVGSDYRFVSEVDISTNVFRSAGKYLVCAVDGAGVHSGTALIIEIKVGLEVVGAGSGIKFQPGQQITLSIEGGGSNLGIESILVAGQRLGPGEYQRAGNNIFITIPPGRTGTFTVAVTFTGGQTATVNIAIAAFDLLVQGVGAAGISMGQTAVASASNLPGNQVCNVTLAGIRLAFLDGDRIDADGCVPLLSGGRLVGNFVMADQNGSITSDLIRRLLDSDGEETLEITTSTGAKASAEVKVGKPAITFDPADGEVSLRDIITIRGDNFPPERSYYNPPSIAITIDGRSQFVYPTGTSWDVQYEITNRAAAGSTLRIEVRIGDYPLSELTALYRIKIAPPELEVNPPTVRVGQPIEVSVSGLEAFTGGYFVEITGGPRLVIDGERTFATGRLGQFTGRSIIPVDYHEDVATPSGRLITLKVHRGRTSIPGVFGNVTLQQQQYVAPTPPPTITPIPTKTPVPTPTPLPTDTPIPPTDTPVPPTNTPIPPTHTPVPPPTDTPVPPPTVDRTAIVQTVTAAVIPSDDDRTVVDRPASEPESPDGGLSAFTIFWLVAVGVILLAIVALAAALVALRSRRVGPAQPPFDDLPNV